MERYLKDEPKLMSIKREMPWDIFTAPNPWGVKVEPLSLEELSLAHDRNSDSFSMSSASSSCSGTSWDSSISCAITLKKEPIDDYYEENFDNFEELSEKRSKLNDNSSKNSINRNSKVNLSTLRNNIELKLVSQINIPTTLSYSSNNSAVTLSNIKKKSHEALPTLTPPSSPESYKSNTTTNSNIIHSNSNNNKNINLPIVEPEITLLESNGTLRLSSKSCLTKNTFVRLAATNNKNRFALAKVIQMSSNIPILNSQESTNIGKITRKNIYPHTCFTYFIDIINI